MTVSTNVPEFCQGVDHFAETLPGFSEYGTNTAIAEGNTAIASTTDKNAIYQTILAADALRYLTLQITASKQSGHPGGFASIADGIAALVMLGYKNIITEVGHHAPGFYSNVFLDGSLEAMGIKSVQDMRDRFREMHGLLGHLSGQIPGLLNPAGPLGQGQHFAMAGAKLNPGVLFPVTIGDGGLGEPYIMSSFGHFNTAYPQVTNFLPILVWNGYSQEHHSMVSTKTNEEMVAYWQGNGFAEVILVNAKDYDDSNQPGEYVDSTKFSLEGRMQFTQALLEATDKAAKSALGGKLTVLIVKQLKGAGVHKRGSKSHNLYPGDTVDKDYIVAALQERALTPEAWQLVRTNYTRANGGRAVDTVVTETELALPNLGTVPVTEYGIGEKQVATTAMGEMVAHVGQQDPNFIVANADGNAASGINNINIALKILHPTTDATYFQQPQGQVYEPLSEDACAGLAAAQALFGARSLWCSYESFAINGLPIWQTVTQAMSELRRPTPSTTTLFTAGALEQGRNGWTHQRPEVENYFAGMMRNGNVFPLFPCDANSIQACYEWALGTSNKGITITASKSPLPIRTTLEQTREGLAKGAIALQETPGDKTVTFAVIGDMTLIPVFEAADTLKAQGIGSKIISVINPRRLYRPSDVAWDTISQEQDGNFLSDADFETMFGGDALIGVTGGSSAMLEPVMLRSNSKRDMFAWKRGETGNSAGQIMEFNGITSAAFVKRAMELMG